MTDLFETAMRAVVDAIATAENDPTAGVGVMDRRLVAKYGRAAEAALQTERFKFIPNWAEFNTARVVPELERQVRDLLKSGGIQLTSWFDPETRRWYRFPDPERKPRQLRNLTRERALAEGYNSEVDYGLAQLSEHRLAPRAPRVFSPSESGNAPKGRVVDVQSEAGTPSQSDYQNIEGNAWDQLEEAGRASFRANMREAVRRLVLTMDWSQNLEIAQVKLVDSLLHGAEWTMASLQQQAALLKQEIVDGHRADDGTEIPLVEIERRETRLAGYKEQYAAFMVLFQETMHLRPTFTDQLPFEWPSYRSREQAAKDREGLRRMKPATSHTLAHVPKEVFETFLKREAERRGYVPRHDGVDNEPPITS